MARRFARPTSTLQFQRLPLPEQIALRKIAETSKVSQLALREAVVRNRGFTNIIPEFAAARTKSLGRPTQQLLKIRPIKLGEPPKIDPIPLKETLVGNDRLSFTGNTNMAFPNRLKNIEISETEKAKVNSTLLLIIAAMVLFFAFKK